MDWVQTEDGYVASAGDWRFELRPMRVRYDRLKVIRDAFTTLAAAVVCFRLLQRDAC